MSDDERSCYMAASRNKEGVAECPASLLVTLGGGSEDPAIVIISNLDDASITPPLDMSFNR